MILLVKFNAIVCFYLVFFINHSRQDDGYYSQDGIEDGTQDTNCQSITIPFCQGIEYNKTKMPNSLGHRNQDEATSVLYQYIPAVKLNCSPDVKFFLCSLYAPVCTNYPAHILPCRSLCLSVRNGCEKFLSQFKLAGWPSDLECSKFPDDLNGNLLCVRKNQTSVTPANEYKNVNTVYNSQDYDRFGDNVDAKSPHEIPYFNGASREFAFTCPDAYRVGKGYDDSFKVGNVVAKNCGLPCDGMFFTAEERQFSRLWISTWSIVCALSCLFTVLTFMLNTTRFRYPERPIIFLAVCYLIIATIYILGFLSGDKVACRKPFPPSDRMKPSTIVQGTKNEFCTIMFIGLYFFSMASSLWWVILALTWFLAAGLKWGHEAIEANSQYFHLAAWAIPTIKTITILAMGKVEGDVLTGVCFIGLWNLDMMRGFVLIPLVIYLVVGTIFLLFGFISLFRIRTAMKHDGTKTDKLEKLMLRIGIFSVLYTVPAVTVIVCLFYELINFDQWMITWHGQICQLPNTLIRCPNEGPHRKPNFLIFMLKYLSSLIVGITSSVWVWSSKTVASWKELFLKLRGKRGQTYV